MSVPSRMTQAVRRAVRIASSRCAASAASRPTVSVMERYTVATPIPQPRPGGYTSRRSADGPAPATPAGVPAGRATASPVRSDAAATESPQSPTSHWTDRSPTGRTPYEAPGREAVLLVDTALTRSFTHDQCPYLQSPLPAPTQVGKGSLGMGRSPPDDQDGRSGVKGDCHAPFYGSPGCDSPGPPDPGTATLLRRPLSSRPTRTPDSHTISTHSSMRCATRLVGPASATAAVN